MKERLELVVKASANFLRPISSEMSLFLERLRFSIPWLLPSSMANLMNPLSVKEFLPMSRFYRVSLWLRNPLKISSPELLILFEFMHKS